MADLQLLLEAEKRGLLPPEKMSLLNEARTRGLIEGTPARANVGAEVPEWGKENPRLYELAVKARQVAGPTVEALGAAGGGILGGTAGMVAGPIGAATGAVGGAGLGYGIAKEGLTAADVALGLRKPRTTEQLVTEPVRNIVEGATYEAGGRVAAPYLARGVEAVGKGLGKVADMRQIPLQRAANIAKGSVGEADEVINALRAAEPGTTPANALAQAGLNEPTAQALLRRAAARDPKFFTDLSRAEDAKTFNALAKIAGGETETATRATLDNMKNALNTMTEPQKQMALNRANLGKEIAAYEKEAGKLSGEAAKEVQNVRDLVSAGNSAEAWAKLQMVKQNLPVGAAKYTFADELAKKALGQWSDAAAQGSLDAGEMARSFQGAADALRSTGIKPLETKPLVENILAIGRNPQFAGNDLIEASVKNVADDMAKWTSVNGIIPGDALDAIRKNSVNAAIRKLMAGADPTTQQQAASSVMSKIRPLIVDAIENAGGTGYREYLSNYTKGSQNIAARKLSAEARTLYRDAPEQFVKLVEGNAPKVVEKILGPGSYDIAKEMSQDAMTALTKAGKQVRVQEEIGKQATAGEQALVDLIKENLPSFRLPNIFSIAATTTNKALDAVEKKLGKATMDTLTEAAKTADSFEKLLKVLPAEERSRVLKALSNAQTWQVLPKGTQGAAIIGATEASKNALAEEKPNRNALAR